MRVFVRLLLGALDQRTIQRNLRRLEVAGHIRRIKRGDFQTDLYELAPPGKCRPL